MNKNKKIFFIIFFILFISAILICATIIKNKELTSYSYDYLIENENNAEFAGLEQFIRIDYEEPLFIDEDGDGKINLVQYRFKFVNITDKPLKLFFHLFYSNLKFVDTFIGMDPLLKYNQEYVVVDVGKHLGTTLTIGIDSHEYYSENNKNFFDENYKEFIGYFRVNGKKYIKRITLE